MNCRALRSPMTGDYQQQKPDKEKDENNMILSLILTNDSDTITNRRIKWIRLLSGPHPVFHSTFECCRGVSRRCLRWKTVPQSNGRGKKGVHVGVCSGIMGNFEHIYLVGPWRCPSKHRFVCPNWAPPHLPTWISAHTLQPSRALLVTAKFAYTVHWLYALQALNIVYTWQVLLLFFSLFVLV